MRTSYGKDAVSVYRVSGDRLFAASVRIDVFGEAFGPSYTSADNSLVVATDTMKNFVHATAAGYEGSSLEEFLQLLGGRFLERYGHAEQVALAARELPFARRGAVLFQRSRDDYATAEVTMDASGVVAHRSGRAELHLTKLTGSSFAGFLRDEFTTLPESEDRPLSIRLDVHWRHADFARRVESEAVRDSVLATFDDFVSASIQHLVHEMGRRVLARFHELSEVSFHAENRLWDAAQLGDGVYTDPRPPFGIVALTLTR